ncbi:MAG: 7-carboxy-7-deazaguanine synthase [Alphaproteobacteria bacterium]|nr:7-carboxy-7-deazaguanine synthase [Alphaproteobacteria bacterium]
MTAMTKEKKIYSVKEAFYTLQGEGTHAGRPAVFCRFAGCNLWTGREADRANAICQFCDTDFVGIDGQNGGKFETATALATHIESLWPGDAAPDRRFCVMTGGEPGLQVDRNLIAALHAKGFEIAIETNGTVALAPGIDWICMSPKAGTDLVITAGDELKLVYPQPDLMPEAVEGLDFKTKLLQPMDGPALAENTRAALDYCLANPTWRLSLQTHKILGID